MPRPLTTIAGRVRAARWRRHGHTGTDMWLTGPATLRHHLVTRHPWCWVTAGDSWAQLAAWHTWAHR